MICSKLDRQLQNLAKKELCLYTRYADDIILSSKQPDFPKNIAYYDDDKLCVGEKLIKIIEDNGFRINENKVNLQTHVMRQVATGLIVNEFVNVRRKFIRQVRSMLHSWESIGLEGAQELHYSKYSMKDVEPEKQDFKSVLLGKISFISMVRNNNKQKEFFNTLRKQYKIDISDRFLDKYYDLILREGDCPIIRTEGKTDWMHLAAAWEPINKLKKYEDLKIDFYKMKKDIFFGNRTLIGFCEKAKLMKPFKRKVICIFDNDVPKINKKHKDFPDCIRNWGNNVYSFILPQLKKYPDKPISIEFFYPDKTIKIKDKLGRRLFFSDEFNKDGKHKTLKNVRYGLNPKTGKEIKGWKDKLEGDRKILDYGICKLKGKKFKSIALSKHHFALNILQKQKGFDKANFNNFKKIFELIAKINKEEP